VTGRFPFEEYDAAYRYVEEQGDATLKIIIDME
jgi:hypothetical protein